MSLLRRLRRRARSERGAVAVVVALCAVILFGMAAMAVDLTQQVHDRQELHDTIDEGAHAGAFELPNASAVASAIAFANGMDPGLNPTAETFCVVGSVPSGATNVVDAAQIPAACNPGVPPYDVTAYPGLKCNSSICAIPCYPATGGQCNTLKLTGQKPVPFGFARAIGITQGSTGTVSTAACKGSCGGNIVTPLDLVVVGDRTGSMGSAIVSLESAVVGLLGVLNPVDHHVGLGTIGRTQVNGQCRANPSNDASKGPWIPVGLSDDWTDPASDLYQAARCIGDKNSGTGTYLAAPMRAAKELLLDTCWNNQICLPGSANGSRPGVKKALIFMTDGEPNETNGDPKWGYPYNPNGTVACQNLVDEANAAKADGVHVVTVAFRLENVKCTGSNILVAEKLAEAASPEANGTPSKSNGCSNSTLVAQENSDGDNFFCTPAPSQLKQIFQTAASQISGSIRLLRLP